MSGYRQPPSAQLNAIEDSRDNAQNTDGKVLIEPQVAITPPDTLPRLRDLIDHGRMQHPAQPSQSLATRLAMKRSASSRLPLIPASYHALQEQSA
jgi:hypothetical protein